MLPQRYLARIVYRDVRLEREPLAR